MRPTRRCLLKGLVGATLLGPPTASAAAREDTDWTPLPNTRHAFLTWPSARGGPEHSATRAELGAFSLPLEEQWRVETAPIDAPLIAVDGRIVTVETGDQLTAYDELTGDQAWQRELAEPPVDSPAAGGRTVVCALPDGSVLAVAATTGATRWETTIDRTPTGLVVTDETVYLTGTDAVVALALDDGAIRWTVSHGAGALSAPTILEDSLIAHDETSQVLGVTDEEVAWQTAVSGLMDAPPVRTQNGVAVLSRGTVISIDPADGTVQWETAVPARSQRGIASRSGFTTATNLDTLVSVSSWDGEELYAESIDDRLRGTSPQVHTPNYVVVATQTPDLRAYDLLTGEQAWTIELNAPSEGSMILGPHKLVCTTGDDTLVAFQASEAAAVQQALATLRDRLREAPAPIQSDEAARTAFGMAAEAYADGDFETATSHIGAADDRLDDRLGEYAAAVDRIEALETAIEELPAPVDRTEAINHFEEAREQLAVGAYPAAAATAETGLDVVANRRERFVAARTRLKQLTADIAAAEAEGLVVAPATKELEAAEAAFADGAYDEAESRAAEGLETVSAIEDQAAAARTAIEAAEAVTTRHTGIKTLAVRLGYRRELRAAESAYEAGDYEAAQEAAEAARVVYRLAALIVDGSIGGSMATVVLYKLRPEWAGRPLDRLETLLPGNVDLGRSTEPAEDVTPGEDSPQREQ